MKLVREGQTAHTRLNSENVVVRGEHVERSRGTGVHTFLDLDGHLGVIDCRYQWVDVPRA